MPTTIFKNQFSRFGFFLLAGFTILSCSDSKNSTVTPTYSAKIQKIVPDSIIKSLQTKGMVLNPGTTPPDVMGIFTANPFTLLAPFGPEDGYTKGKIIPDYKYKFYDQKSDEVKIDYKNISGTDNGTGIGAFLSGTGKKFSLFAELSGTGSGIPYKHLTVISGEITADGIKDFQYAFVMKEKTGDPTNSILIATGKSRIWVDGDSLASKTDTYRLAFPENQSTKGGLLGAAK